jgi:hypothetical protein
MPRFVVLEHAPGPNSRASLHWDLMLESGGVLRAWALARPPGTGGPIAAEALADHRLAYLEYQGPLTEGRGAVRRWDEGTYAIVAESPLEIVIELQGNRWSGRAVLRRERADDRHWRLDCPPA